MNFLFFIPRVNYRFNLKLKSVGQIRERFSIAFLNWSETNSHQFISGNLSISGLFTDLRNLSCNYRRFDHMKLNHSSEKISGRNEHESRLMKLLSRSGKHAPHISSPINVRNVYLVAHVAEKGSLAAPQKENQNEERKRESSSERARAREREISVDGEGSRPRVSGGVIAVLAQSPSLGLRTSLHAPIHTQFCLYTCTYV